MIHIRSTALERSVKIYPQFYHNYLKNIHFSDLPPPPKTNIDIQNFEPPKNGLSLRIYENIRVPPPSSPGG